MFIKHMFFPNIYKDNYLNHDYEKIYNYYKGNKLNYKTLTLIKKISNKN